MKEITVELTILPKINKVIDKLLNDGKQIEALFLGSRDFKRFLFEFCFVDAVKGHNKKIEADNEYVSSIVSSLQFFMSYGIHYRGTVIYYCQRAFDGKIKYLLKENTINFGDL